MAKPGHNRRKFGKSVVLILIIAFITAGIYIFGYSMFSLQKIEVVGNNIAVNVDNEKIPKNLLFFPTDRIRKELISTNPLFADIRLEKIYPHTLKIVPIIRTPFVTLVTPDRVVVLDKDGVVLMDGDNNSVIAKLYFPNTDIKMSVPIGNDAVKTAIMFIDAMQETMPISWVKQIDALSLQAKSQDTNIYITQNKSIQSTLSTLQTLIAGFRIKGNLPTVVDLRFDKPIVTF